MKAVKKILVSMEVHLDGAKLIPVNSVIMTSRATIGECVINLQESTTNQGMLSLIPDENQICTLQLYYWIKRNKVLIESIGNGSTFKEVYKRDFEKLTININRSMLEEFMDKTTAMREYYISIMKENILIEELKMKIMQSIF